MAMNYRRFKIKASLDGREICYWVKVFDTQEQMTDYVKAADKQAGKFEGDDHYGRATGYCQKWNSLDETGTLHPTIGQILLNRASMGGSVLGHEVMHAAWWAYDTLTGRNSVAGIDQEEELAYLFSDLYNMATNKMYGLGIWQ
jgi:hypothetical protein